MPWERRAVAVVGLRVTMRVSVTRFLTRADAPAPGGSVATPRGRRSASDADAATLSPAPGTRAGRRAGSPGREGEGLEPPRMPLSGRVHPDLHFRVLAEVATALEVVGEGEDHRACEPLGPEAVDGVGLEIGEGLAEDLLQEPVVALVQGQGATERGRARLAGHGPTSTAVRWWVSTRGRGQMGAPVPLSNSNRTRKRPQPDSGPTGGLPVRSNDVPLFNPR